METSNESVSVGVMLEPQLSAKTSFANAISDTSKNHNEFRKRLDDEAPLKSSLALLFPSFMCETKLDGERIIAHVKRGIVTLQSRRGNWFSRTYSPVIGR